MTKAKRSTEAENLSEQRLLRAALSSRAESVIIVNGLGQLVCLNDAGRRLPKQSHAPGRSVLAQIDERGLRHRGGRPMVSDESALGRALKGETVSDHISIVRVSPGIDAWISCTASPTKGVDGRISGAMAVFSDVTAGRHAGETLRNERDRLVGILCELGDGVYIVTQNRYIEYVNPVLRKEFGEPTNKKCHQYFHNRDQSCPWCRNQQVLAGNTIRWEWHSYKVVSIRDEGPGMAPEKQSSLCQRYYRARSGSRSAGLELGLSFTRLTVKAHGGACW